MVLLLFSKFSQQRTEKKVKKWQDLHIKVNGEQKNILYNLCYCIDYKGLSSVGVAGFEPTTPCSQSRCANRTALHPECFTS